jgi:hypothetical protein
MPFTTLTKPTLGTSLKKSLIDGVIDNLNFLHSESGGISLPLVPNGSFEQDADSDGFPDGWSVTNYTGGSFSLATTDPAHGARYVKFTRPSGGGNGGGYIQTTDYIPCSEFEPFRVRWLHKSSAAGLKNQVVIYWFTAAQAACSTASSTVYSSTANPTAWTQATVGVLPPTTARYCKVRLIGGFTDTDVAGDSLFDDVQLGNADLTHLTEFSAAGTFTWTCPSGITVARVTCCGGGGGGGGGGGTAGGGGGGAGGQATSFVALTPGNSYTVVVGASGAAGSNGATGGNSSFNTSSVTANGGVGGLNYASGGTGGAGGSASGQEAFTGGTGGTGNASTRLGGNGGSCSIIGSPGGASTGAVDATAGIKGGGGGGGGGTTQTSGAAGGAGCCLIEW